MADEPEITDPFEEMRDGCKSKKCSSLGERLTTCNDRVNGKSKTSETCVEEVIDFFHCVDHCATKDLFNKLK